MEIVVKIEAPGLMEALMAIAEQMQAHNALLGGETALNQGPVMVPPVPAPPVQPDYVNPAPVQAPVQTPPQAVTPAPVTPAPVTPAPAPPAPQQAAPPVVPTVEAPSYTQQDMAMACVQLMDMKGQARIMEIMAQFGVQALTQLDKSQYGVLAQVLRNEGVNI